MQDVDRVFCACCKRLTRPLRMHAGRDDPASECDEYLHTVMVVQSVPATNDICSIGSARRACCNPRNSHLATLFPRPANINIGSICSHKHQLVKPGFKNTCTQQGEMVLQLWCSSAQAALDLSGLCYCIAPRSLTDSSLQRLHRRRGL